MSFSLGPAGAFPLHPTPYGRGAIGTIGRQGTAHLLSEARVVPLLPLADASSSVLRAPRRAPAAAAADVRPGPHSTCYPV